MPRSIRPWTHRFARHCRREPYAGMFALFMSGLSAPIGIRRQSRWSRVMSTKSEALKKRMIRRHELRQIVPLADTTIYEMEQRGEFPRRFALSPRCIVWDLGRGPRLVAGAAREANPSRTASRRHQAQVPPSQRAGSSALGGMTAQPCLAAPLTGSARAPSDHSRRPPRIHALALPRGRPCEALHAIHQKSAAPFL